MQTLFCLFTQLQDPSRNLLKKLDGVNTINGVYSGEYQLSDVPSLGDWKIKANILDQVCVFKFNKKHEKLTHNTNTVEKFIEL